MQNPRNVFPSAQNFSPAYLLASIIIFAPPPSFTFTKNYLLLYRLRMRWTGRVQLVFMFEIANFWSFVTKVEFTL